MSEKILACPYCGGEVANQSWNLDSVGWIDCDNCGACGPRAKSLSDAILLWNAAANALAKKDEEIEQLRKERGYWLSEYRRHVASTEKERDELEAEIERWKAEYVRIYQECDAFNRTNEEVFNENRKLKSEYAELRATLNNISDLMLKTEKQRDELKKELSKWRDMVIPLTSERDEARKMAQHWYNAAHAWMKNWTELIDALPARNEPQSIRVAETSESDG